MASPALLVNHHRPPQGRRTVCQAARSTRVRKGPNPTAALGELEAVHMPLDQTCAPGSPGRREYAAVVCSSRSVKKSRRSQYPACRRRTDAPGCEAIRRCSAKADRPTCERSGYVRVSLTGHKPDTRRVPAMHGSGSRCCAWQRTGIRSGSPAGASEMGSGAKLAHTVQGHTHVNVTCVHSPSPGVRESRFATAGYTPHVPARSAFLTILHSGSPVHVHEAGHIRTAFEAAIGGHDQPGAAMSRPKQPCAGISRHGLTEADQSRHELA